jgi:hypothetical protein
MSNPMTTIGDIIVAAAGGTPIRLASIANSTCTGPITLTNAATVQRISLTANCVLTFPSAGLFPGQLYTLRLAQDATGGRTVSVSANVHGFMVVSTHLTQSRSRISSGTTSKHSGTPETQEFKISENTQDCSDFINPDGFGS